MSRIVHESVVFEPNAPNSIPRFVIRTVERNQPGRLHVDYYAVESTLGYGHEISAIEFDTWGNVGRHFENLGFGDQFKRQFPGKPVGDCRK